MNAPHQHPHARPPPWWARVHQWLFDTEFERGYARLIDNSVGWLIILSVLAIVAEHNELLYVPNLQWFQLFDVITVGVFTLEYLLRIYSCVEDERFRHAIAGRVRYAGSGGALIDGAAPDGGGARPGRRIARNRRHRQLDPGRRHAD